MKRYSVAVLAPARREAAAIIAWWRINRSAAAKLFANELRAWLWLVLDDSRGGLATLAIAVAVR